VPGSGASLVPMASADSPVADGGVWFDSNPLLVAEHVSKLYPHERTMPYQRSRTNVFGLFRRRERLFDGAGSGYSSEEEDDDDEDDEDDDDEEEEPVSKPSRERSDGDEKFWALRDVSFSLPRGGALGVLGDRGSGKTTLLRIIAGDAFPTNGSVRVHGRVSPLAAALAASMRDRGKITSVFLRACRLHGYARPVVEHLLDGIFAFAEAPMHVRLVDDTREAPTRNRLALAAALLLPSDVLVLDDLLKVDDAFRERAIDYARHRLDLGHALVFASRKTDVVGSLCDRAIWLDGASVATRGEVRDVATSYQKAVMERRAEVDAEGGRRSRSGQAGQEAEQGRAFTLVESPQEEEDLRVPPIIRSENARAALLAVGARTEDGEATHTVEADEPFWVEIHLESRMAAIEVRCAASLEPSFGGRGVRLEASHAIRFDASGTFALRTRVEPGTLASGLYDVRADAIVANTDVRRATVIARDGDRLRILGDLAEGRSLPETTPVWDGRTWSTLEGDWSVEPRVSPDV